MRWPLILLFCIAASSPVLTEAQTSPLPDGLVPATEAPISKNLPKLPPGKSTVMGGRIENVDLVRDQLALKVAGGHSVKVLFDERTQVYHDGKKISILNLKPEDYASIETMLDGTAIFAVRIHALSSIPGGQLHGQIVGYDPARREMKLKVADAKGPMLIFAPEGIEVVRVGDNSFAQQPGGAGDLMRGAMVNVAFNSGKNGTGTATRVEVLAVPGAQFVLRGELTTLDLRAGRMTIANGADGEQPMDVQFDPARYKASKDLKKGATVKATVQFDGTHFMASDIAVE